MTKKKGDLVRVLFDGTIKEVTDKNVLVENSEHSLYVPYDYVTVIEAVIPIWCYEAAHKIIPVDEHDDVTKVKAVAREVYNAWREKDSEA